MAGCSYPYFTKQARDHRKKIRYQKINPIAESDNTLKSMEFGDSNSTNIDSTIIDSTQISSVTKTDSAVQTISDLANDSIDFTSDSLNTIIQIDSLDPQLTDTSKVQIDSMVLDSTLNTTSVNDSLNSAQSDRAITTKYPLIVSPDSLNLPVQYESVDSMIYDIVSRKVFMYGEASVFYEQYVLKAGYIEFDFTTNVAMATCLVDSNGNEYECPFFDDKNQQFSSRRIEFNFKSKKGKVYDASTQQGDGYLVSKATKFISTESSESADNIIFSKGCIYTTCDHETPHFGIRASSAKIIPNKLIVVGPSYLEIMGTLPHSSCHLVFSH